VTYIGGLAFSGCDLTSVTIPDGVTSLTVNMNTNWAVGTFNVFEFNRYSGLTSISVSDNNTAYSSVDGVLFNKTQTTLLRYPRGKQGTYSIPNSVTSIASGAFGGCTGLISVTIPNSVISIEEYAFENCENLASVTIGNGVTSIGHGAFYDCNNLTSVTIGSGVSNLSGFNFHSYSRLTSINVSGSNTICSTVDGVLFNKDTTALIKYPRGKQGAYSIPNSVISIYGEAFHDCTNLTSVTIPNRVMYIEGGAFYGCTGLTSVTIGSNVTNIGQNAFYNCTNLTSLTNNSKIPQTLSGSYNTFYMVDLPSVTLYVPSESISAYEIADIWKDFGTITAAD